MEKLFIGGLIAIFSYWRIYLDKRNPANLADELKAKSTRAVTLWLIFPIALIWLIVLPSLGLVGGFQYDPVVPPGLFVATYSIVLGLFAIQRKEMMYRNMKGLSAQLYGWVLFIFGGVILLVIVGGL